MPGVYISYPFCAQKCTYCNFASGVLPRELESRYVETLCKSIAQTEWPWTPETVYLGGGTPSQMDVDALAMLLVGITGTPTKNANETNSKWREATMECAPGTITRERVDAWRNAGINRVSLGVQSFIDRELARTGRKHNAEIVESDVRILRDAGIDSINIDLIAGLPGQTRESWVASLEWVEKIAAPHASVYMLEVDEDSRLGQEILLNGVRYGARDVPADDAIADFYELAVERLASIGLARYEISNFARERFESTHNLKYWRREPYFGFGADAHSFDGTDRWQNSESASAYVDDPRAINRTTADPVAERFFLGLRLSEGIAWTPGGTEATSDENLFDASIRRRIAEGLLEFDGSRLRLTNRGVMLSNEVFADFVSVPA
jgi:oxygen-independent coproporphyrinogen III oxidase